MDLGGGNWAILNIVGPLLLAAVLLWALLRNRKSRERDVDRPSRRPATSTARRRRNGAPGMTRTS